MGRSSVIVFMPHTKLCVGAFVNYVLAQTISFGDGDRQPYFSNSGRNSSQFQLQLYSE